MSEGKIGRREATKRALWVLGVGAVAPSALAGCGGGDEEEGLTCTQTGGLSPAEASARTAAEYVDRSTTPDQRCNNCRFFTAGGANQCGSCTLLRGPINPEGYCNLWQAQPA